VSLKADVLRLDAQIAELTPTQREAMRTACVQIAAALTNLGTAIPDGTTSPIASTIERVLIDAAFTYRPGKAYTGLRPKMMAALEECPTLRAVAAEFLAKLLPPTPAAG
jgi:hypothetical protein